MEQDSVQQAKLQLAIQAYQEIVQQRQQYQEEAKSAHGAWPTCSAGKTWEVKVNEL